jgi:hypothetical protein
VAAEDAAGAGSSRLRLSDANQANQGKQAKQAKLLRGIVASTISKKHTAKLTVLTALKTRA